MAECWIVLWVLGGEQCGELCGELCGDDGELCGGEAIEVAEVRNHPRLIEGRY